jgi:hypothetical protein
MGHGATLTNVERAVAAFGAGLKAQGRKVDIPQAIAAAQAVAR